MQYNDAVENKEQAKYDLQVQKEATKQANAENAQNMFNNLKQHYENKDANLQHNISLMQNGVDIATAKGHIASTSFYDNMISENETRIKNVKKERDELAKSLDNFVSKGLVQIGDDRWIEMSNAIKQCDEDIQNATKSTLEYQKAINQIKWDKFDLFHERINLIASNRNFAVDVLNNSVDSLFDRDTGLMKQEGMAIAALHYANAATYRDQAKKTYENIQQLEEDAAELKRKNKLKGIDYDPWSDQDWLKKYSDYQQQYQEDLRNEMNERKALIDLQKEANDSMLKALQKAIDKRKESLKIEKETYDYQKRIRDQVKDVTKYHQQLHLKQHRI